ncbi:hypothetical protein SLA2020_119340, partial [Shorea laevis]
NHGGAGSSSLLRRIRSSIHCSSPLETNGVERRSRAREILARD